MVAVRVRKVLRVEFQMLWIRPQSEYAVFCGAAMRSSVRLPCPLVSVFSACAVLTERHRDAAASR